MIKDKKTETHNKIKSQSDYRNLHQATQYSDTTIID